MFQKYMHYGFWNNLHILIKKRYLLGKGNLEGAACSNSAN